VPVRLLQGDRIPRVVYGATQVSVPAAALLDGCRSPFTGTAGANNPVVFSDS
jgi:hypothetical protein